MKKIFSSPEFLKVVDFISEKDFYLTSTKTRVIFHFADGTGFMTSKALFNAAWDYANGYKQER